MRVGGGRHFGVGAGSPVSQRRARHDTVAVMQAWLGLLAIELAACNFPALPRIGDVAEAMDARAPAACGDLTCDPNATCETSPAAACRCNAGFVGDGMACSDVDECAAGTSGCPVACANTSGSFACYVPKTCAEIKDKVPDATDGAYTLYLGGDAKRPWTAWCARMTTATPREYLTLTRPNTGQYAAGGFASGTTVTTTYAKVRFSPASLKIDISDRSFAASQGVVGAPGGVVVTSMPLGVAMDCAAQFSHTGIAMIDLTGTSFVLMSKEQFSAHGSQESGTTDLSNDKKQATITGGGACAWNGPTGLPANPFNDNVTNGALLELVYSP